MVLHGFPTQNTTIPRECTIHFWVQRAESTKFAILRTDQSGKGNQCNVDPRISPKLYSDLGNGFPVVDLVPLGRECEWFGLIGSGSVDRLFLGHLCTIGPQTTWKARLTVQPR